MERTFIPKQCCCSSFDCKAVPVQEIDSGQIVTFETNDAAYERLWREGMHQVSVNDAFNLVTGPIFIRGAEPGDALCIEILDIAISRAWVVWLPHYGPLGQLTDHIQIHPVKLSRGRAHLSERLSV